MRASNPLIAARPKSAAIRFLWVVPAKAKGVRTPLTRTGVRRVVEVPRRTPAVAFDAISNSVPLNAQNYDY